MNTKIVLLFLFFLILVGVLRILIKNKTFFILIFSALFSILYYILYLYFSLPVFFVALSLQVIFIVLSTEDILHHYLLTWHFIVLFINVVLLRIFLDIPLLPNIFSPVVAAFLLGLPYLLTKGKGIGVGDPIVFMILSIVLTPVGVFVVFLFTVFFASLFGIVRKLFVKQKTAFALVPFIYFAFFLYFPLKSTLLHLLFLNRLYEYQWIGVL